MRAAIIAMMILLLPAALFAGPTMGIYFTYNAGQMTYSPTANEMFTAYVYAQGTQCYLNAAEFEICYPPGILEIGFEVPPGSLTLGASADEGLSIAYWPPMDGWNPGYNLLCTLHLFAADWCRCTGGTLSDAPATIVPHHDTGLIQGSCWPENYLIEYTGLASIFCPEVYGVQETNWGAIKSLF
jgi:hypothetical protein